MKENYLDIAAKLNSLVFNKFDYNSPAWRDLVKAFSILVDETCNAGVTSCDWREMRLIGRARRFITGLSRSTTGAPTRYYLCTLMKSATKHIEKCFAEIYSLERLTPSFDFHDAGQSPSRIKPVFYAETDFMYGESFASYHLFPGDSLLKHSLYFQIPIFVMLRNPAQTIVSHYHYCIKNSFNSFNTLAPGEYYGPLKIKTSDDLRSLLINYTLPRACQFIRKWLKSSFLLASSEYNPINIFYHEDLVHRNDDFYSALNAFLGIKLEESYSASLFTNLKNHNMRSGKTDEWRDFFSSSEIELILSQITPLAQAFPSLQEKWEL